MKTVIRRVAALVIGLGIGAGALAGLEVVTHISDLNTAWPLGSDLAATADDHIRNIKVALKTDFPNVNAAVTPTPAQFNQLTTDTFTSNSTFSGTVTAQTGGSSIKGALTIATPASAVTALTINGDGTLPPLVAQAAGASEALTLNSTNANGAFLRFQRSGTSKGYIGNSSAIGVSGGSLDDLAFATGGANNILFSVNAGSTIHAKITSAGVLQAVDDGGTLQTVGWRDLPSNTQSGSTYTTVMADRGKVIISTAGGTATFTIDSNANVAYPIGSVLTFTNRSGGNLTIAITSDTMFLAGTATTGSRTVALQGIATALKVQSTVWIISGAGVT